MKGGADTALIYTRSAHCRDCYKCLRNCPVSCISMNEGQAQVLNEQCIACGSCIRSCPQNAKQYAGSIAGTERMLRVGVKKSAISVAPSFAANLDPWQRSRLPSALRLLGFDYVYETASGAYYAARESLKYIKDASQTFIHSSCPAAINYITKYRPHLAGRIAPVVSPMIAHAKMIKEVHGADTNVVFAGPCTAKKDEAAWQDYEGLIEEVLTFEEVMKMLKTRKIDFKKCDESAFDKPAFYKAQYYPLPGGILKTLDIDNQDLEKKLLCIDGADNIKNALDGFEEQDCDIEIMWCEGGCLNGPVSTEKNIIKKRLNILTYAEKNKSDTKPRALPAKIDLYNKFKANPVEGKEYTEVQIEKTLKAMGKEKEEDRLNCAGCGYHSCRDKAIAILNGYAQKEMCMPYLRKHLFMQSSGIIDSMPGGIVILDGNLNIVQTNASFNKMFRCDFDVTGSHISLFVDQDPFERVLSGEIKDINWLSEFPKYNLKCRFLVYNMKDANQLAGIFIPLLNDEEFSKIKSSMKMKALEKARELLKHQIETSQKIARYLGTSTAQSQDIVNQIMHIASDEADE